MPRYPTKKMEIEQCEPESAFLDDANKLVSFVNAHNNTLSEYVKVTRMYLFGTPIRRTGDACPHATPGYVPFHVVHKPAKWRAQAVLIDRFCSRLKAQVYPIETVFQQAGGILWKPGGSRR
jgi:hypothetical protein